MTEKTPHILLVEDEEAHAELIRRAFEDQGGRVKLAVACDLQEAGGHLAESKPDLIITDLLLPDGKGIELLPPEKEEAAYPVVIMTSHGDEQVAVEAMKAGALDYVVKSDVTLADMPRIAERALREWGHIIERKRAEEKIRRRNRELALLNRVIAASATSLEPEEVLETACRELALAFEVSQATATLLNEKKTAARVVAEYLVKGPSVILHSSIPVAGNPLFQHLLTNKTPFVASNVYDDPSLTPVHETLRERGTVSLLMLPLIIAGEVVGSLDLEANELYRFSAEEISLAWRVADQVAGALARARLDKAHRLLSTAVEQTAEMVTITDTKGTILYVNPAFERITGYSQAEVIGQNPRLLKSGQHDAAFYQELWATISSGQVWRGRLVNRKKDGSLYTEEATITPVRDENDVIINYVAVKHDITHELRLEEQLRQSQKMEAVGQLAGGVAHDFNNILQAILGYTDMAMASLLEDSPAYTDLGQVMKAANRAASLVRQLLIFSRRETTRPYHLDLNEVISNLVKMLQRIIGEHIDLEVYGQNGLKWIYADPGQIEQILMNLCLNARDAMPNGGKITIETENVHFGHDYDKSHAWPKEGDFVLLSVSDTGAGIPTEIQDRIFEPFFTTKEVGQGTGLGLATVYAITKQHDGLISVHSEPEQGTTFRICFPAVQWGEKPDRQERTEMAVVGGNGTILLAEDDESVRRLAAKVLEKAGYRVLIAHDGEEALRLFEQQMEAIDLVLLDAVMPKKSGRAVYDAIKTRQPQMPILFSTGYSRSVLKTGHLPEEEGLQLIRKPYSPSELLHKMKEMLETKDQ